MPSVPRIAVWRGVSAATDSRLVAGFRAVRQLACLVGFLKEKTV